MSDCVFVKIAPTVNRCEICGRIIHTPNLARNIHATCWKDVGRQERAAARELQRKQDVANANIPQVARDSIDAAVKSRLEGQHTRPLREFGIVVSLLMNYCKRCNFFTGAGCKHPAKECRCHDPYVVADAHCPRTDAPF